MSNAHVNIGIVNLSFLRKNQEKTNTSKKTWKKICKKLREKIKSIQYNNKSNRTGFGFSLLLCSLPRIRIIIVEWK